MLISPPGVTGGGVLQAAKKNADNTDISKAAVKAFFISTVCHFDLVFCKFFCRKKKEGKKRVKFQKM